jgi:hypothetical protein
MVFLIISWGRKMKTFQKTPSTILESDWSWGQITKFIPSTRSTTNDELHNNNKNILQSFTMAPASNGTNDSLEQLFHKLLTVNVNVNSNATASDQQPYLFLVQHSLSFQTRQTATTTRKDDTVYTRAGLRTPTENSKRDFIAGALWLQYIVGELQKESSSILWVQTSSRRLPAWLQTQTTARSSKIKVLDAAAVDPFGWDSDASSEPAASMLNDLNQMAVHIENHHRKQQSPESDASSERIPIVIESLTPLIMRHGLQRTIRFLERICQSSCPVIVAVRTETLPAVQHQVLEDLAQATLCLQSGEAVLLRQGVREKGNMVRENLPYRISTTVDSGSGRSRLQVDDSEALLEKDSEMSADATAALQSLSLAPSTAPTSTTAASTNPILTSGDRPAKVKMELQDDEGPRKVTLAEESPATATTTGARIYIQEDDPEFQDYDEEDPDDDLDL